MNRLFAQLSSAILLTAIVTQSVAADDWPAWRGDGSGISPETGLPYEWATNSNVTWRTAIDGEGVSSPIVWRDRIFLTLAKQGTQAAVSHWVVFVVGGALILLALAAIVSLLKGRTHVVGDPDAPTRGVVRMILGLDRLATIVVLLFFLLALASILVKPELIASGSINRAWLMSGLIGMLGTIGAFGLLSPSSSWRPFGALVMLAAAISYHLAVPDTRGANAIENIEMLISSAPMFLAAGWNLFVFALFRRQDGKYRRSLATAVGCLSLLFLVGLQFTFLNYMRHASSSCDRS